MSAERYPIESVLVSAGIHGGEGDPGVPLVESLHDEPLIALGAKIDALIANPEAVRQDKRFIHKNLSFCLTNPEAGEDGECYEAGLVPDILRRAGEKDFTIDIHGQHIFDTGEDFAYVGPRFHAKALGVVALAGIKTVIIGDFGLVKHFSKAALFDISPNPTHGRNRNDVTYWRNLLKVMLCDGVPAVTADHFALYAHTDLTPDEAHACGIDQAPLQFGQPIARAQALLGIRRPVLELADTEVIAPLRPDEVCQVGDDLYRAPTLRTLRN